MNFLFDLTSTQPNLDGQYHGGGKYAKKIFIELLQGYEINKNFFAVYDSSKTLDTDISYLINKTSIELIDIGRFKSIAALINEYSIKRLYSALPYSISYNFLEVFNTKCEIIITIHGLRELELLPTLDALRYTDKLLEKSKILLKIIFKNVFYKRKYNYYKILLEKAQIITVSNHTKYALLAYFPNIKAESVKVYYSPDVTEFSKAGFNHIFNEKNYFLLISGNRWLKNNLRPILALDQVFTERPEISNKVIITGVKNKEFYLNKISNKEQFLFFNYIDESFLEHLYKNSFAFLYMSLNEGFGYPPLEAMKHNIPVIASPFTSISEICGDAALYCNPYSVQEIKNRVLQLFNKETYNKLGFSGKSKYNEIRKVQDEHLRNQLNYLLSKDLSVQETFN